MGDYNGWDSHQSWELNLALENNEQAYKNLWAYFENYEKKLRKGKFDDKLAIKGLIGWIDTWQPKVRRLGYYSYPTTPMEVKVEVAKHNLANFYEEMRYKGVM